MQGQSHGAPRAVGAQNSCQRVAKSLAEAFSRSLEPAAEGARPFIRRRGFYTWRLNGEPARKPFDNERAPIKGGAGAGAQRGGEKVESLARRAEDASPLGSARASALRSLRRRSASLTVAPLSAAVEAREVGHELGAHGNGKLRRRGRRRRAHVGGVVDQRRVGLVADRGNERDFASAAARTTISSLKLHRSSSEPPPRATISTSGLGTGSLAVSALKPRIAAATSAAEVSPCTRTGQTMTRTGKRSASRWRMSRMTAPVGEVTTPTTRGKIGKLDFARRVEQAFGLQRAAARVEERHQRADARRLQRLDDELVRRLAGKCGNLAGGDDLHAFFRLDPHALKNAAPDHRVEPRARVLEAKNRHDRRNAAPCSRKFPRAP